MLVQMLSYPISSKIAPKALVEPVPPTISKLTPPLDETWKLEEAILMHTYMLRLGAALEEQYMPREIDIYVPWYWAHYWRYRRKCFLSKGLFT